MPVNLFRDFNAKAHQHDRPDDAVEADNFLSYQMNICRPEFVEFFRIVNNACCCQIIDERIKPDVYDMLGIKGNRDAPCKACTGLSQNSEAG